MDTTYHAPQPRRRISLSEIGDFFGVDPMALSSIHLDANSEDGALQFEIRVVALDLDNTKIIDSRGRVVKDTLRIAVVK